MTRSIRSLRRAVPAALVVVALALALGSACGGGGSVPATQTPQPTPTPSRLTLVDGGQGGVTVWVTWLTPGLLASRGMKRAAGVDLSQHLAFHVRLHADSLDLSKSDLARISVLRDLAGGEYQAEAWLPWSFAPHDREGLLLFRKVELGSEGVELVIRGLGGVIERSYRWSEPPGG